MIATRLVSYGLDVVSQAGIPAISPWATAGIADTTRFLMATKAGADEGVTANSIQRAANRVGGTGTPHWLIGATGITADAAKLSYLFDPRLAHEEAQSALQKLRAASQFGVDDIRYVESLLRRTKNPELQQRAYRLFVEYYGISNVVHFEFSIHVRSNVPDVLKNQASQEFFDFFMKDNPSTVLASFTKLHDDGHISHEINQYILWVRAYLTEAQRSLFDQLIIFITRRDPNAPDDELLQKAAIARLQALPLEYRDRLAVLCTQCLKQTSRFELEDQKFKLLASMGDAGLHGLITLTKVGNIDHNRMALDALLESGATAAQFADATVAYSMSRNYAVTLMNRGVPFANFSAANFFTSHGDLPAVVPTAATIEAAKSFVLTAERFSAATYNFALRILAGAIDAQDTQQIRATFTTLLAEPQKPNTFPKALAARSALAYEPNGHDLLREHLSAAASAKEFARLANAEVINHAGHAIAALVVDRLQKALIADDHEASLIYAEDARYCFHALAAKGPREIQIAVHSLGYRALLEAYNKGLIAACLNLYPSLVALHETSQGPAVPHSTIFAEAVFGKLKIPQTDEELEMLQIVFENLAKNESSPNATIQDLMRAQTELPIPAADLLRDPDLIRAYGELMGRVKTYLETPPVRRAVA